MAKASAVAKNEKRKKLAQLGYQKRQKLKKAAKQAHNEGKSLDEVIGIFQDLNKMNRDYGNPTRVRNRCLVTGRPRGYRSRFKMSRNVLRELASIGEVPGVVKSSW